LNLLNFRRDLDEKATQMRTNASIAAEDATDFETAATEQETDENHH